MDRTSFLPTRMTCARRLTAALVASTMISTICLAPGAARADDTEGDSRRATEVAPLPPRVVVISDPRVIKDWQEGEPIPAGYHPVQRMRKGAIVAGAVTFGVLYIISALVAAIGTDTANVTHSNNDVAGLFVPVAGPFITMTQSSSATADVFLVMDGAAQAAGAILLVYGLTSPQTVLVRDAKYSPPLLLPKPMILGRNGAGLGLVGSF
jgi:hypothetical protein